MANVHIYLLCEALTVSANNRDTLFAALQAIQSKGDRFPAQINHWRMRQDNGAMLFSALFDEDDISIPKVKQYLGNVFGILDSLIGNANNNQGDYGLEVVFSYPSGVTDRIRWIALGYDGGFPTWDASRRAANAYITANAAEWDVYV